MRKEFAPELVSIAPHKLAILHLIVACKQHANRSHSNANVLCVAQKELVMNQHRLRCQQVALGSSRSDLACILVLRRIALALCKEAIAVHHTASAANVLVLGRMRALPCCIAQVREQFRFQFVSGIACASAQRVCACVRVRVRGYLVQAGRE
jgi:hypothetical protein